MKTTNNGTAKIPIDRYDELCSFERNMKEFHKDPNKFWVFDRYGHGTYFSLTKDEVLGKINEELMRMGKVNEEQSDFYKSLRSSKIFRLIQWLKIIPKFPGK